MVQDCFCSATEWWSSPCCLLVSLLLMTEGLSCLLTETLAISEAGRYAWVSVQGNQTIHLLFLTKATITPATMESLQFLPHQSHQRLLLVVVITTQKGKQHLVVGKTSVIVLLICSVLIYIYSLLNNCFPFPIYFLCLEAP